MDMEELNKTQLILLALLLSFVTSIATGIVTVSLMDQAPPGVTQTINRVIERTVEVVQPGKETQVIMQEKVIVREGDLIEEAVQKNIDSLVVFYIGLDEKTRQEIGSGFLVTSDGLVATDVDIAIRMSEEDVYGVYGGETFATRLVSYEEGNYAAIIKLDEVIKEEEQSGLTESFFKPSSLASEEDVSLGSTVIGVDATGGVYIAIGIVTKLEKNEIMQEDGEAVFDGVRYIHTDILMSSTASGGPLVLSDGLVAGLAFVSREGNILAIPSTVIKSMLDIIAQKGVETMIGEQTASVLEYGFKGSGEEKVFEVENIDESR
ncbi:MAG: trypsin-like peptidase domain-containing protein [Candidatus Pacebacteria bacterium]|nr:trypsin-like peptidase domain-containing protein [Candidatus Paceibacterota bacterium]